MWGIAKRVGFVFRQLKDDAVALVDVIAPPDFILDSPIGRADGEVKAPPTPLPSGASRGWLVIAEPEGWPSGKSPPEAAVEGVAGDVGVASTPRAFL